MAAGCPPWLRAAVFMSAGMSLVCFSTATMSSFENSGCLLIAPLTPATYTAWCLLCRARTAA